MKYMQTKITSVTKKTNLYGPKYLLFHVRYRLIMNNIIIINKTTHLYCDVKHHCYWITTNRTLMRVHYCTLLLSV